MGLDVASLPGSGVGEPRGGVGVCLAQSQCRLAVTSKVRGEAVKEKKKKKRKSEREALAPTVDTRDGGQSLAFAARTGRE